MPQNVPKRGAVLEIMWHSYGGTEQVVVENVSGDYITIKGLQDNAQSEEYKLNRLPFDWKIIKSSGSDDNFEDNNKMDENVNNTTYQQSYSHEQEYNYNSEYNKQGGGGRNNNANYHNDNRRQNWRDREKGRDWGGGRNNKKYAPQQWRPIHSHDEQEQPPHEHPDNGHEHGYGGGHRYHSHGHDYEHGHEHENEYHEHDEHHGHDYDDYGHGHQSYEEDKQDVVDESLPKRQPIKPIRKDKPLNAPKQIFRSFSEITDETTGTDDVHRRETLTKQEERLEKEMERKLEMEINNEQENKPRKDETDLPLTGDLIEITQTNHSHDGAGIPTTRIGQVLHCNRNGRAMVAYKGDHPNYEYEETISLFARNTQFQILETPYSSEQFIPAPRVGDIVEIQWRGDEVIDKVRILKVTPVLSETYENGNKNTQEQKGGKSKKGKKKAGAKTKINHFKKWKSIEVEMEYLTGNENPEVPDIDTIDFHPSSQQDMLSWETIEVMPPHMVNAEYYNLMMAEQCLICYTPFKEFGYQTISCCGHDNICAKCALRARFFVDLIQDKPMCPLCKEPWEVIAFVRAGTTVTWDTLFEHPLELDNSIHVYFEDLHTLSHFSHLRSLYCPVCEKHGKDSNDPNSIAPNKRYNQSKFLMNHMRNAHEDALLCSMCLEYAHLFIDEQRIFSKEELYQHERYGSQASNGFPKTEPHAWCNLCRQRFYSKEFLVKHCEEEHFSCHRCQYAGVREYFSTREILEQHFRTEHHLCEHPQCMSAADFVVFDDPMSLQLHQESYHGHNYAKNQSLQIKTSFRYEDTDRTKENMKQRNEVLIIHFDDDDMRYRTEEEAHRLQSMWKQEFDENHRRYFGNRSNFDRRLQEHEKVKRLGLRHIPDACPKSEFQQRNKDVILRIRTILASDENFKWFQRISSQFSDKKMSASDFFLQFKTLFSPLCEEEEWVDVMMQMLSLLTDHMLRRQLYAEYKAWKMTGHTMAELHAAQSQRTGTMPTSGGVNIPNRMGMAGSAKPSAAAIVAGKARRVRGHGAMAQYEHANRGLRSPIMAAAPTPSDENIQAAPPQQLQGAWARGKLNMQARRPIPMNARPRPQPPVGKKQQPPVESKKEEKQNNKKKKQQPDQKPTPQKNETKGMQNEQKTKEKNLNQQKGAARPQGSSAMTAPRGAPAKGLMPHEKSKGEFVKTAPWATHAKPQTPLIDFTEKTAPTAKPKRKAAEKQEHKNVEKKENETEEIFKNQAPPLESVKTQTEAMQELVNASKSIDRKNAELLRKLESCEEEIEEMERSKVFAFLLYLFRCCIKSLENMCGLNTTGKPTDKKNKPKNPFNPYMLSSIFRRQVCEVIGKHFVQTAQFNKDMPIYASFGTQVFAIEILQSLPKWSESTAVSVNGLLSLITEVRLEQIEEFSEWIDQTIEMLSNEELYGLSLYLWFVLDTQIPTKEFMIAAKEANKTSNKNKNTAQQQPQPQQKQQPQQQQQQQQQQKASGQQASGNKPQKPHKPQKPAEKKHKKQKKRNVVLFRIGL